MPTVFAPEHMPPALLGREEHLSEVLRYLSSSAGKQNVWICGATGSGKTLAAKALMTTHASRTNVRCVYVSCYQTETAYAVLDHILTELRVLLAETPRLSFKAARLAQAVSGKPLVVVMDEIDKMTPEERESVLHILDEIPDVSIICISEKREALAELKPKTINRVSPVLLEFGEYSTEELERILRDRAECGLAAGTWNRSVLEMIARASNGDARIAVQTLRAAAHIAESEAGGYVEEKHVHAGLERTQTLKREYVLRKLTPAHRQIYQIVRERGSTRMGHVLREYLNRCEEQGVKPVSRRSFYRYCEALRRLRLVSSVKSRSFGNFVALKAVM